MVSFGLIRSFFSLFFFPSYTNEYLNPIRHHRNDPSSAWGGTKDSGVGRENGREAYYAYSQSKSTIINYAPEDEVSPDSLLANLLKR